MSIISHCYVILKLFCIVAGCKKNGQEPRRGYERKRAQQERVHQQPY